MSRAFALAFAAACCGCYRPHRATTTLAPDLDSFGSTYAVVARVWAEWTLQPASIEVSVHSAVFAVPGFRAPDSLPVVRQVARPTSCSALVFQCLRRLDAKRPTRRDDACECTAQDRRQHEDRRVAEIIEMHVRQVVVRETER